VGGDEGSLPGGPEPSVRDHSGRARVLIVFFETRHLTVSGGQFSWGGNGNQTLSVKAKESLTVRPTSRAGAKAGLSDPTVPSGRAVAQRTKVTLGISLWSRLTVRLRQ